LTVPPALATCPGRPGSRSVRCPLPAILRKVGPDTCGFPNALLCGTTLAVAPTTPVDAAVAPAALDGTGLVRPGKKRRHGRHGAVGPILSRTGARRFASRDIHTSLTVEALVTPVDS
jgi:hypothetical protein